MLFGKFKKDNNEYAKREEIKFSVICDKCGKEAHLSFPCSKEDNSISLAFRCVCGNSFIGVIESE